MKRFCLRSLYYISFLISITFLCFLMLRIAGSDVVEQKMMNTGAVLSPEVVEQMKEELGLDQPVVKQYFLWLKGVLHGDMGSSYVSGVRVFDLFLEKLPNTLFLAVTSLILTIFISLPIGVLAAVKENKWMDHIIVVVTMVGNSMPNFLVAFLLIYLISIRWNLLPVMTVENYLPSVILPACTLAIAMSAKYIRQIRKIVIEELKKDYVTGARARGLSEGKILWEQVLKSCSGTILTIITLSFGSLLGGTAIVEAIFMWNGVGRMAVDAIEMRDYPVIISYVMWMGLIHIVLQILSDLVQERIDPRIRIAGGRDEK